MLSCARLVEEKRPNFVFMLVDDLGWKDVGVYGSSFYETPNIDKLAAEGMRFTDAYAACPVCSPTRASILTGKYPARLNITDWIGGSQKGKLLPAEYEHEMALEEDTLAEALKAAGYSTGFLGKWHLGKEGYYPEDQGFDINLGGTIAGQPASYFYPYKNTNKKRETTFWDVPGLEGGEEGEYLTDRMTDESLKFIEANKDEPFLLYLSHFAVHTPIQSKEELTVKYDKKIAEMSNTDSIPNSTVDIVNSVSDADGFESEREAFTKLKQNNSKYAGMIESTDDSLGRIMDRLAELGLEDNTIVIFMSDNGGLSTLLRKSAPTSNSPLRSGKGWLYEGGIRVPMIVKWKNRIQPGAVSDQITTSTDFYPTMMDMAGLKLNEKQHKDGVNLLPVLTGKGTVDRENIFWHFPHYHGSGNKPSGAVRSGDFKLIEWYEDGKVELYDLKNDLSESSDLSEKMADKTAELRKLLNDWRIEVDGKMPVPNPDWKEK